MVDLRPGTKYAGFYSVIYQKFKCPDFVGFDSPRRLKKRLFNAALAK